MDTVSNIIFVLLVLILGTSFFIRIDKRIVHDKVAVLIDKPEPEEKIVLTQEKPLYIISPKGE